VVPFTRARRAPAKLTCHVHLRNPYKVSKRNTSTAFVSNSIGDSGVLHIHTHALATTKRARYVRANGEQDQLKYEIRDAHVPGLPTVPSDRCMAALRGDLPT
jgi:hypothetical protein